MKHPRAYSALILAGLVALCVAGSYWREGFRPGMRCYQRGVDALAAHNAGLAEREWLNGARTDPAFEPCFEQLGDLYTVLRRYPEAADNYAHAVRLTPSDGSLYVRLSRAQHLAGRNDAAYASAKRAAELLPDDADALGGYGVLEAERKNNAGALADLRRAHALSPNNRQFLLALANIELDTVDFASAERDLTAYLRAFPDDARANYMMAVVYNQKPRTPANVQAALGALQRALPGMVKDERVYVMLGQLYLDTNAPHDALDCYLAGRQQLPNSESILHGLVETYGRLGDTRSQAQAAVLFQKITARKDRIQHLKHVLGFNHDDVAAALELARLQEEDGSYMTARRIYDQMAGRFPLDTRLQSARDAFYKRMGFTPSALSSTP